MANLRANKNDSPDEKSRGYSAMFSDGEVIHLSVDPTGRRTGNIPQRDMAGAASFFREDADLGIHRDQIPAPTHDEEVGLKDHRSSLQEVVDAINGANAEPYSVSERGQEHLLPDIAYELGSALHSQRANYVRAMISADNLAVTPDFKNEMRNEQFALADTTVTGAAANLKLLFRPYSRGLTVAKIPKFAPGALQSFKDFVHIRDDYSADKFFDVTASKASNPRNEALTERKDPRGECDVNYGYYLNFLPVTTGLKKTLLSLGVSSTLVNSMGNFTYRATTNEDDNLGANSFKDTLMFSASETLFPDYAGPDIYADIVKDLIDHVKNFHVNQRYMPSNSNMSPDLAAKMWMMGALNAVFLVFAEDATGVVQRSKDSLARAVNSHMTANPYDLLTCMLGDCEHFMKNVVKSAKDYMTDKGMLINQKVYDFIKPRFGPVIRSFKSDTNVYLAGQQMNPKEYLIRILGNLVLPINPYDSGLAKQWDTADLSKGYDDEEADTAASRSAWFTPIKLNYSELDKYAKVLVDKTKYFFENWLSRAVIMARSSKMLDVISFSHIFSEDKTLGTTQSFNTLVDKVKDEDTGYWLMPQHPGFTVGSLGGDDADSIYNVDMCVSTVDREVLYDYTNYQVTYPILNSCKIWRHDGGSSDVLGQQNGKDSLRGIFWFLAGRHTNPFSIVCLHLLAFVKRYAPFRMQEVAGMAAMNKLKEKCLDMRGLTYPLTVCKTFKDATLSVDSKLLGDISPADFNRYAVILDTKGTQYLVDNTTGNKAVCFIGKDADGKLCHYVANFSGDKVVDPAEYDKLEPNLDGSLMLPAVGRPSYSEIAGVPDMIGVSSLPLYNGAVTAVKDLIISGGLHKPFNYVWIKKPALFPTCGMAICASTEAVYSEVPTTYSKVVEPMSWGCIDYSLSSQPSNPCDYSLSFTLAGGVDIFDTAMSACASVLKQVLKSTIPVSSIEADNNMLNTAAAVDEIFGKSSAKKFDTTEECERNGVSTSLLAASKSLVLCQRSGFSLTMGLREIIEDYSAEETPFQLPVAQYMAVTGVGQLNSDTDNKVNHSATKRLATATGCNLVSMRDKDDSIGISAEYHKLPLCLHSIGVKPWNRLEHYKCPVNEIRVIMEDK